MKKVSLQQGDLFESGPCDLLVLPCSTAGTVGEFVEKRIRQFNLPWPNTGTLGSVDLIEMSQITELFSLAPRLAYAHSVKGNSSSLEAIERIALSIGDIIKDDPRISKVFIPLLGTGAGGLDRVSVWKTLCQSFLSSDCLSGELVVLTPSSSIYSSLEKFSKSEQLRGSRNVSSEEDFQTSDTKRVFISYTAKNSNVEKWVEWFATELCEAGINARLDKWDLKLGMSLPDFMASEISLADRVVIVSDEFYADRANGKIGGVGWETMLIQGDYLTSLNGSRKYILVTLGNDRDASTPSYLKTSYSIHLHPDELEPKELLNLVRELHSISVRPKVRSFSEWTQKLGYS